MSLLTSIALLLATLMPPPLQHVHAAGDTPHSHSATSRQHGHDGHHHHHGASAGNTHHHHGHALEQGIRGRAIIPHAHLSVFFFDFTLPQGDDGKSGSDVPLQLPPVAKSESSLSQATSPGDAMRFLDAAIVAEPCGHSYVSIHEDDATPIARNLLCDSARCARNGVLLI